MVQQPCSTYYLHVYDVESGLWVHTILGSGVSPRIREAMNAICQADGILSFIGTRSEFGLYLSELKNTHGKDYRHCWTSLPASTILSMLGLCQNMPMSGRPELVFNGSPLTVMIALLVMIKENGFEEERSQIESSLRNTGLFVITIQMMEKLQMFSEIMISVTDYEEALSYVVDNDAMEGLGSSPHVPVAILMREARSKSA